jgi:hypothetical protein
VEVEEVAEVEVEVEVEGETEADYGGYLSNS